MAVCTYLRFFCRRAADHRDSAWRITIALQLCVDFVTAGQQEIGLGQPVGWSVRRTGQPVREKMYRPVPVHIQNVNET